MERWRFASVAETTKANASTVTLNHLQQLQHGHDPQADEIAAGQDQADADEPVGANRLGEQRGVDDERMPGADSEGKVVAGGGNFEDPRRADGGPDNAKANDQVADEQAEVDFADVADI